ncbi:hypothetical protein G9P44_005524 [Scheffersomyces stipitis]|nr:hypothetical protein G9P44_005524 [Scheffersomyces stipitis]
MMSSSSLVSTHHTGLRPVSIDKISTGSLENDDIKLHKGEKFHSKIEPTISAEETTVEVHSSDAESVNLPILEDAKSDTDRTTLISRSTSAASLAPNWVYGTTLPSQNSRGSTSSVSGLCLTERGQITVPQPEVIQNMLFPANEALKDKIVEYREKLSAILNKDISDVKSDFVNPLLVVTGPTHIKEPLQAKACAQWIGSIIGKKFVNPPSQAVPESIKHLYQKNENQVPHNVLLSLRTNLTKYNHDYSSIQSKDPVSVMTFEIEQGIPVCRALLCELAEVCPIVGETSDTITPQYLSDLFCLGIVGSTFIESQLHRELASGVSYPIGFNSSNSDLPFDKEMYGHRIVSALDSMYATGQPHQFLSVTKVGTVAVVGTTGNEDTFVILQLNLQLDFDELKAIINKVYSYSKLTRQTPRVMLDLGRVSTEQYAQKLSLLQTLLQDPDTMYKVVGVMIDSGDHYIPEKYPVDLTEDVHLDQSSDYDEDEDDHRKMMELNKYFVQRRMQKTYSVKKVPATSSTAVEKDYEYVINADKLISELEKLSKRRIEAKI